VPDVSIAMGWIGENVAALRGVANTGMRISDVTWTD
jgi:hypothetical protein